MNFTHHANSHFLFTKVLQHVLREIRELVVYVDVITIVFGNKAHGQCTVTKVFVKLNSHIKNALMSKMGSRLGMDHFVGIKKDILNVQCFQVAYYKINELICSLNNQSS